ncbi:MAG: IS110 family transposase [Candidatus Acidiferrales bacterium]
MHIVGCDFHSRYQQIAVLNEETGEVVERRLEHENGEARAFYASLPKPVRVGLEATGYTQWFERLLQELGHELWVGDAAAIRASVVRKQKYDERDARHILLLLTENRFPRIWMPSLRERDLRQLLLHRVRLVQWRTRLQNQLHAVAMGQGLCRKKKLWTRSGRQELESLPLDPWARRRRRELLELYDRLNPPIEELDDAVWREAHGNASAARLMTHPGVGPLTSLAFVLTMGPASRFARGKQVASYLGLNPREDSSGGHRRTGAISKQGSSLLRWLLVEAGQTAARRDLELHRFYQRVKYRRGSQIAKVAVARKLAVRLYWMLRNQSEYAPRKSAAIPVPGSSSSAVMSGSASGR